MSMPVADSATTKRKRSGCNEKDTNKKSKANKTTAKQSTAKQTTAKQRTAKAITTKGSTTKKIKIEEHSTTDEAVYDRQAEQGTQGFSLEDAHRVIETGTVHKCGFFYFTPGADPAAVALMMLESTVNLITLAIIPDSADHTEVLTTLQYLGQCPNLRNLQLPVKLNKWHIIVLHLSQIAVLDLNFATIDKDAYLKMSNLQELQGLFLDNTDTTAADLESINAPKLCYVSVRNAKVTPAEAKAIQEKRPQWTIKC